MFDDIRKVDRRRKIRLEKEKLTEEYKSLTDEELDEEIDIMENQKDKIKEKLTKKNRDLSIAYGVRDPRKKKAKDKAYG